MINFGSDTIQEGDEEEELFSEQHKHRSDSYGLCYHDLIH